MKFRLAFLCFLIFAADAFGFSTTPSLPIQMNLSDSLALKKGSCKNTPATLSVVSGSITMAVTGISIMTYLSWFGLIFGVLLGIGAVVMGIRGLIRNKKLEKAHHLKAPALQSRSLGMGKSIVGMLLGTVGVTILGLMLAFFLTH
ncbi:MAG: hypothetical protein U0X91_05635 [Spirosomataceae bacterium]